jgi:beta-1,4-N-acetylglucosaminyltransferase
MPPAPPGFYNPPGTTVFIPLPSLSESSAPATTTKPATTISTTTTTKTSVSTTTDVTATTSTKTGLSALITTGATAPFPSLIHAALTPRFLTALADLGFTHLHLQAGTLYDTLKLPANPPLVIDAFDFHPDLAIEVVSRVDVVISHAGAGSVLDALRWGKRLVVVENKALMNGHQRELIEELQGQGYLVEGVEEKLEEAVEEVLRVPEKRWAGGGGGLVSVLEEETGVMKEG